MQNIKELIKALRIFHKTFNSLENDSEGLDNTYLLFQLSELIRLDTNNKDIWLEINNIITNYDVTKMEDCKNEITAKFGAQIKAISESYQEKIKEFDKQDFNQARTDLNNFLSYYKNNWKPWFMQSVLDPEDTNFIKNSDESKHAIELAKKFINNYKAKQIYNGKWVISLASFVKQPNLLTETRSLFVREFIESWKTFKKEHNFNNFKTLKTTARKVIENEPNQFAERVVNKLCWIKKENKALWIDEMKNSNNNNN